MYITSIFCNITFLVAKNILFPSVNNQMDTEATYTSWTHGFNAWALGIIIVNALIGIMTSLFIKTFNSILKAIVSAIELILTAVLGLLIFKIPIYWNTFVAIFIVAAAILIYAMNPLQTQTTSLYRQNSIKVHDKDNENLLPTYLVHDMEIDGKA